MEAYAALDHQLTLEALAKVKADSLIPVEQQVTPKTLVAADTYQQRCLKYPHRATFLSYPAFIQALLFESQVGVTSFIPNPFSLHFCGRRYIPQFYVIESRAAQVVALTADGTLNKPPSELLQRFFQWESMSFKVVAYEEVLMHEAEALNWLRLIQVLVVANQYGLDTRQEELEIIQECAFRETVAVGDLISPLRRSQLSNKEIALYRLLHSHRLEADMVSRGLDYDSEITVCV